jgi:glutamate-1-semialdehyde 2,1-aminomutase
VGGEPPVIARGSGSRLFDLDGNEYIDYVGSYGPLILGHAYEPVVTAIGKAAHKGATFGAPTELETLLAEQIVAAFPSVEQVRFVSSGTEAAMTAIRLARGVTGRAKIIKCVGCYHGHSDPLLVSAGSGATTLGTPSSPGVPASVTADTLLVPYNDADAVRSALDEHAGDVAAVLLEPVAGNMGVIVPDEDYLPTLRSACDQAGALLVFDEVMTGFRVDYGGVQTLLDVSPDVTVLGKVIGGGLPVGALGASREIMGRLAPAGPVYQAGTLSGNPAAMAAGLATLRELREGDAYEALEAISTGLAEGLADAARQAGIGERVCVNRQGSMLCVFFAPGPVRRYEDATASNTEAFAAWFHAMLDEGVYLPPSQFEAWFVSTAHSEEDVERTLEAASIAMARAAELM